MNKAFYLIVVLLIGALLLSACGGSGSASGQSGSSGTGSSQSGSTGTGSASTAALPTTTTGAGTGSTSATTATTGTGSTGATTATTGTTGTGSTSATTATTSSGTGGAAASGATGDPKAGEALFTSATIGTNPGCKTCHSIDGSKLVGPSLQGIASRAGTRVPGQSADQYIRTSILDPNAYVVQGFPQGVMPSFKTVLSDTQLNDLVAYLMTLK